MAGHFSGTDEERCEHYAPFLSHLRRNQLDALYWCLFFLVLGSLFLASWVFQWLVLRDCGNDDDMA